ncbi:hypothetical protein KFK09_008764 [Dendrobium nobile]|uniref:CCHC-type domain-containing protein n=1 Tax=Dendrobium nobile TaxID=94219 RepID=A0A8T3BPZ1_DENNO|nr:hypothetical protein KFK09_008764 [Dendrobium nobile]
MREALRENTRLPSDFPGEKFAPANTAHVTVHRAKERLRHFFQRIWRRNVSDVYCAGKRRRSRPAFYWFWRTLRRKITSAITGGYCAGVFKLNDLKLPHSMPKFFLASWTPENPPAKALFPLFPYGCSFLSCISLTLPLFPSSPFVARLRLRSPSSLDDHWTSPTIIAFFADERSSSDRKFSPYASYRLPIDSGLAGAPAIRRHGGTEMEQRRLIPSDAWKNYRNGISVPVLDSSEVFNGGSKILDGFNKNFKGLFNKPLIINEGGFLAKEEIPSLGPGRRINSNIGHNTKSLPSSPIVKSSNEPLNFISKDVENVDVDLSLKKNTGLPVEVPDMDLAGPGDATGGKNQNVWSQSAWRKKPDVNVDNMELGSFLSEDGKMVVLHAEKELENVKRLEKAIVVKTFGDNIPFHVVSTELRRQWEKFGKFHIIGISSPVWIRLPNLPLQCWDEVNICRIASLVGKPYLLDGNMFQWSIREFARVCVRIPLDMRLPQGVWVKGSAGEFYQKVEYEGVSKICTECGTIGHSLKECGELKQKVEFGYRIAQPVGVINGQTMHTMAAEALDVEKRSNNNPWIQVQHVEALVSSKIPEDVDNEVIADDSPDEEINPAVEEEASTWIGVEEGEILVPDKELDLSSTVRCDKQKSESFQKTGKELSIPNGSKMGSHSYEKKVKLIKEIKSLGSGNIISHNRKMDGGKTKKISYMENSHLMKFLGMKWDFFLVLAIGLSGGLMVLWRKDLAKFSVIEASSQMILGMMNVTGKGRWVVASVYCSTDVQERMKLWDDLESHCAGNLPMVVGGDFNCVLSQAEKRGGKRFTLTQGSKDFNNFMIRNDLHEVKSMGPRFTWCNNKSGGARILEKLDRCLINSTALDIIHLALVKHLTRVASDHCPIMLEIFKPVERFNRIIRYEEVWATYYGASTLVKNVWMRSCRGDPASVLNLKFKRTLKALFYWSKAKFKDLSMLREKLRREILEIQLEESEGDISLDKLQILRYKINELNVTLARINTWWRQRAKARWMDEGDCNSSFFHAFANARRSTNWISHIKTESDGWPKPSTIISNVDQKILEAEFLREELQEVVDNSKSSISPGLDEISFSFIKDFWQLIKGDVWLAANQFFSSGVMDQSWKETLIVLIPKIICPQELVHFKPISLCLTIYKLIAKMLLNRLEKVFQKIISVDQEAFVRGRSLSEHVLLAQEVFNKFRWSKARSGMFAIKLDMEQAYNKAKIKEVKELKEIISNYCNWMGQKVNNLKSMIIFGRFTKRNIQKKIVKKLKFKVVKEISYLGVKMTLRRMIASDFQVLLEAATNRLNTWGKKCISLEVPLSILKEIDKMCRGFLWSKNNGNAGLHYASWDLLYVKLSSFISNGERNLEKLKVNFGVQLMEIISNIPININRNSDVLELKCKFAGKSVTALAFEAAMVHEEEVTHWNWLKKLKLKPKIELFWWRLCKNALMSNTFLVNRRLSNFPSCPRGCGVNEDNCHLVGNYFKIRNVVSLLNSRGFSIPIFNGFLDCLECLQRLVGKNSLSANILCIVVYLVWKSRCKDNWDANQQLLLFPWHPPPPGWIKINVDASLKRDNMAGIGGIARDEKGRFWVAFGAHCLHWDISQLELLAVFYLKNVVKEWMFEA